MIDKNRAEFINMNVLKWREAGYTGKGSTVVVLDTPHKPYPHTNVVDLFNDNNSMYGHKGQVAQVIREVAPDSEIIVFSWTKSKKQEIIDWIKEHESEIDVINVSLALNTSLDMFKQLESVDVPIFLSTGNGSKDKIQTMAKEDWLIAVGAWEEHRDNKALYSNYGEGIDIVAYTNIYITAPKGEINFNGTSCSAPVASSLVAIYNGFRKKQGLSKMTRAEAFEFVKVNTVDKLEKGFDIKSGHGLLILPAEIPTIEQTETPHIEESDEMRFKDMENHWAKDYVDFVADKGLMKGYEEGAPGPEDDTFRPDAPMTRAEVATVIARMMGFVKK